jgi:predicted DNA-binding protein
MPTTNAKSQPLLTQTIAVRLSEEESRALAAIAHHCDRTVSYIVREQLRLFLRDQQQWSV